MTTLLHENGKTLLETAFAVAFPLAQVAVCALMLVPVLAHRLVFPR